jgi:hypothetical protein
MANKIRPLRKPTHAVVTLPDPDLTPSCSHVEYGGTLEFRCDTPNYPYFQVLIDIPDPAPGEEQTFKFLGNIEHPVVIPVTKDSAPFIKAGEYPYRVEHYKTAKKPGKGKYSGPKTGGSTIFVKHCKPFC